jgi:hypothetical protein
VSPELLHHLGLEFMQRGRGRLLGLALPRPGRHLRRTVAIEARLKWDFAAARERLLSDFPDVQEVIATTAPAALLVLYAGHDEVDAWLDALLDTVAARQAKPGRRLLLWRGGGLGGGGAAA